MGRFTIKSQLLLMLMLVGVAAVASVSSVAFVGSRDALDDLAVQRVEAQHAVQMAELNRFLHSLDTDLTVAADSTTTSAALTGFAAGLDGYANDALNDVQNAAAVDRYLSDFATGIESGGVESVSEEVVAVYRPDSPAGRSLQNRWVINAADRGALDGKERFYDRTHDRVHGYFSDVAEGIEAEDLLLVSLPDGVVVYSVSKNLDLGANVLTGGLAGSGIARAVLGVQEDPGRVHFADISRYRPVSNDPSMFVAAPVIESDRVIGAVVARLGVEPLNRLLTADRSFPDAGFGSTGQSYLVGTDGLYRSQDRTLVERPEAAAEIAASAGLNDDGLAELRRTGSPVLLLPADPALLAADGGTLNSPSVGDTGDSMRESMVAATGRVAVPDLGWLLVAEVSVVEARDGVTRLQRDLLVALMVLMVTIGVISIVAAQVLARPFNRLLRWAETVRADGAFNHAPTAGSEFRSLVGVFHDLAVASRAASDLAEVEVERAQETRAALVPRVLATSLTESHAAAVEEYPEVVVATVRLISAPGGSCTAIRHTGWDPRPLPTDGPAWLDDVVLRAGRNQLRVIGVGEGYCQLASGLSEPRLNQERDLLDWLHRIVDERPDVVGGLASGDLSAAAVGVPPRFVEYWGPAVAASGELARTATEHGPGSVGLDARIARLLDRRTLTHTTTNGAVVETTR